MGRLRVLVGAYKKWAIDSVAYFREFDCEIACTQGQLEAFYKTWKPDVVVLIGWSWIVSKHIYSKTPTLCYHPSDLPNYRGGSPIQHQILDGLTKTRATLFLVNETLDGGPIIFKRNLSLEGSLEEINARMKISAGVLVREALRKYPDLKLREQSGKCFTYKRRKPEEGEITIDDFKNKTSVELYNFIRMLGTGYHAFIRCKDGKKLYLK